MLGVDVEEEKLKSGRLLLSDLDGVYVCKRERMTLIVRIRVYSQKKYGNGNNNVGTMN